MLAITSRQQQYKTPLGATDSYIDQARTGIGLPQEPTVTFDRIKDDGVSFRTLSSVDSANSNMPQVGGLQLLANQFSLRNEWRQD